MAKAKRVGLYLRVSSDESTTENQRLALRTVAERKGWEIVQEYEDSALSGALDRDKRPAFARMLKDAARHRFDVLMCWSIDRIARRTRIVCEVLEELESHGIAFYAEQQAMDTSTTYGRAMLQMAAVFAELERGVITERIHAGLKRAWSQGKRSGRKPLPSHKAEAVRAALARGLSVRAASAATGVSIGKVHEIRAAMIAARAAPNPDPVPTDPLPLQ